MKQKIYIDKLGVEHTEEGLIEFMGEDELKRRIKMGELVRNNT